MMMMKTTTTLNGTAKYIKIKMENLLFCRITHNNGRYITIFVSSKTKFFMFEEKKWEEKMNHCDHPESGKDTTNKTRKE